MATTHRCILRCLTQLGFEASKPHACVERSIKSREIPFSWQLLAPKKKGLTETVKWCERTRRSERWTTKKSRSAVVSPLQGLAMNQFLLLLNRMTARILARNTVTWCRRLSRDCFGDVLHNIFAKERLYDDHCTNSSLAHGVGYTWIH